MNKKSKFKAKKILQEVTKRRVDSIKEQIDRSTKSTYKKKGTRSWVTKAAEHVKWLLVCTTKQLDRLCTRTSQKLYIYIYKRRVTWELIIEGVQEFMKKL